MDVLVRNHVTTSGLATAPAMVFGHGFGCDQQMWRFVAPAFERDHRVVRFDYVGCGRSDVSAYDPARYGSLDGYAQDLLDVCAALELRDVVFVGHSVSGMIGALAAIREPERFAQLVMVCPSPCYLNDPPGYAGGFERSDIHDLIDLMERNLLGWANFLAPLAMKGTDRPDLSAELATSFCAGDPSIGRRFAKVVFLSDHRAELPRVRTPSLILQCRDDTIAPATVGEYMARHLANSTLHLMAASGHCPHLSHPQETISAIRDYLVRVPA